ncbi:MAG TPA: alkaline phosphatase family protein [Candidatus Dormibacteraeota bacterium]
MLLTRREAMKAGLVGAGAAGLGALPQSLRQALATPASPCGALTQIEHVVIFIQENRSFDHYFGRYPGVRGFDDRSFGAGIFAQKLDAAGSTKILPYHLDTALSPANPSQPGECINDIDHQWLTQHLMWNGGACDQWVYTHAQGDADTTADPANAPSTMGYYERADLEFYWALADQFTICDNYHCSVIGGTDLNRLFTMSGTIDPDGWDGGAQWIDTRVSDRQQKFYTLGTAGKWITYPERLTAAGVSWKVYGTADGQQLDNVLYYFNAYRDPTSQNTVNATTSQNPGPYLADFTADCAAGTLPQVSWVLAGALDCEHPPAPLEYGMDFSYHLLSAVTANPAVWAKTLVLLTYDENGGFFDHVKPPVPPARTPGEHIPSVAAGTPAYAESGNGAHLDPIGLGFRVPMLLISPFTRGGLICSDRFDHTSILRLLETRFGAEIPGYDAAHRRPGLTSWRRGLTGDLASAINLASASNDAVPTFTSAQTPSRSDARIYPECTVSGDATSVAGQPGTAYPPPATQSMPMQEPAAGPPRRPDPGPACATGTGGGSGSGGARVVGASSFGGSSGSGSGSAAGASSSGPAPGSGSGAPGSSGSGGGGPHALPLSATPRWWPLPLGASLVAVIAASIAGWVIQRRRALAGEPEPSEAESVSEKP